jgi:hypothetical protein
MKKACKLSKLDIIRFNVLLFVILSLAHSYRFSSIFILFALKEIAKKSYYIVCF